MRYYMGALIGLIIVLMVGCQLYDRDKSFDSSCTAKCETCNQLELQCDHVQVDNNLYTQNHPSGEDEEDEQKE